MGTQAVWPTPDDQYLNVIISISPCPLSLSYADDDNDLPSVQCVSKNATLTILTIPWYHDIMILYKHCKPYSVISYISYVCLNSVKFICSYFHSLSEWTKTMAGVFLQKKQDQSTRTTFSNAFAWKLRGERIRSGVAWDLCRIKISKAKLDSVQFFRTLIQFRDLY